MLVLAQVREPLALIAFELSPNNDRAWVLLISNTQTTSPLPCPTPELPPTHSANPPPLSCATYPQVRMIGTVKNKHRTRAWR